MAQLPAEVAAAMRNAGAAGGGAGMSSEQVRQMQQEQEKQQQMEEQKKQMLVQILTPEARERRKLFSFKTRMRATTPFPPPPVCRFPRRTPTAAAPIAYQCVLPCPRVLPTPAGLSFFSLPVTRRILLTRTRVHAQTA